MQAGSSCSLCLGSQAAWEYLVHQNASMAGSRTHSPFLLGCAHFMLQTQPYFHARLIRSLRHAPETPMECSGMEGLKVDTKKCPKEVLQARPAHCTIFVSSVGRSEREGARAPLQHVHISPTALPPWLGFERII